MHVSEFSLSLWGIGQRKTRVVSASSSGVRYLGPVTEGDFVFSVWSDEQLQTLTRDGYTQLGDDTDTVDFG